MKHIKNVSTIFPNDILFKDMYGNTQGFTIDYFMNESRIRTKGHYKNDIKIGKWYGYLTTYKYFL